jgi:ribosomal subunit interface protein
MTIRVHSPFQVNEQLQSKIDQRVGRLKRFFDRIRAAEVYLQELEAEQSKSDNKVVELKVYMMRRVLHATEHSKDVEEALHKAVEKVRKQLRAYEQEVALV